MAARKKLGEILLEMGAIDPLQLQSALGYQQQWGVPLGKAVVDKHFCSSDDVLRALSLQTGLPVARLDGETLDSRLASVVPLRTAERMRVVPLRLEGKRKEVLVIAIGAPADLATLDAVQSVSGKQRIVAHVAHDEEIERAIGRMYYGKLPEKQPRPAVEPLVKAAVVDETEFELEAAEEPKAPPRPPRPVLLYGWHEASVKALKLLLERANLPAEALGEESLDAVTPEDILITTTLALQTALPSNHRVRARLIICGVRDDVDVPGAKALGARVYLRPPFTTEQLQGAVQRCLS